MSAMKRKSKKAAKTPLEKAIARRQRTIQRMDDEIANISKRARIEIAKIEKRRSVAQVLLTALREGKITP